MKTPISLINNLIPCSYREDCISDYKKIYKTSTRFYEGCTRKHMLECANTRTMNLTNKKDFSIKLINHNKINLISRKP